MALETLGKVLLDPKATWTTKEQQQAMLAVLKREQDVMAMLKTGGGKSMLAIIPAVMMKKEGIILTLPLKSLMTDWERKLTEMKIPFQVYHPNSNGGRLRSDINLILVSADRATHAGWRQALATINQVLPVTQLVFDEAHLVLLSEDFRKSLTNISELRQLPMQLILLSGTVPPQSVMALKSAFRLTSDTIQVRQSSNRPELEYVMERAMGSPGIPSKVMNIVKRERQGWKEEDRGLVFVTYVEDGKALAAQVSEIKNKKKYKFADQNKIDQLAILQWKCRDQQ